MSRSLLDTSSDLDSRFEGIERRSERNQIDRSALLLGGERFNQNGVR